MSIDPVIALAFATFALVALNAWWVLRPFERARREAKKRAGTTAE